MKEKSRAIYKLVIVAICVAFIALCSYIAIPFAVNFSLQLFAVFLISGCFPPTISVSATVIYLMIGIIGLPVFSGFNSGISAIVGASGGFLISFVFASFIISVFQKYYYKKSFFYIITASLSLIVCYIFGSLWYVYVFCYPNPCSLMTALTVSVFPFIFFDISKLLLAFVLLKKLRPFVDKLSL